MATKYLKLNIPKENARIKLEVKNDLLKIPRLDDKRIAVRQFLIEAKKLKKGNFCLIACPLFSGLIPATLFKEIHNNKLSIFEYMTVSSLSENNLITKKENYKITFSKEAKPILDKIKNDLMEFIKINKLDISKSKILLIDSNIASGITIAYFIKALEELNYNFNNLTLIITDSRIDNEKSKEIQVNLLHGGKLVLFNTNNMTNKVFDNVLSLSAYKKDVKTFKTFNGEKIEYNKKQVSFYPYFLSLALLKQEILNEK